jgi:hypothetical protein
MRVLLDTNVIVSALLYRGRPAQALIRCLDPDIVLVTSEYILGELEDVLRRKSNWAEPIILGSIERLRIASEMIAPSVQISECRDPDDNRILEAALAGSADCIVTGDADLLSMRSFRGMQIVSVAAFLARLNSGETP